MNIYAESSAVLAWLLGEDQGSEVRRLLADAETVVASDLTLVEIDRVLLRAVALGEMPEALRADRRAHLNTAATRWNLLHLGAAVVERARQTFPHEPIRTLDALHVASALTARSALAGLQVLSLDVRVRAVSRELGFGLQPPKLLAESPGARPG